MTFVRMIDVMAQAFGQARKEGRVPLSWQVNLSAERELMLDPTVAHFLTPGKAITDLPFFGLPITVADDRHHGPRYTLTTATKAAGITFSIGRPDSGN